MSYWEKRWAADLDRFLRDAEDVIRDIDALHQRAERRIRSMAMRIRRRFQIGYGLSEEKAKELLAAPVGRAEYLELLERIAQLGEKNPMRDELMARAAAPSYAFRVSMQEAMLDELDAITARLADEERGILESFLLDTAQEKSQRAGYLIQLEAGMGFRFNGVSEEMARWMIHRPWSGLEFSARIWQSREALAELLNEVLIDGLTAGNSTEAMAAEIAERIGVSKNRARTLVRTETNYVCNAADRQAYDEAEIGRYIYCATLDMRTSKICQSLDGTIHDMEDAAPGKNYPPMHPNCRSVTRPHISSEELKNMTRWSRDPVTGKDTKVPANMSYERWLALQEDRYGEERVSTARKMAVNKSADRAQFRRYVEMLGRKQMPPSVEKFQQVKYLEPEEWEELKAKYAEELRKKKKRKSE